MTIMQATIWFRGSLVARKLSDALDKAANACDFEPWLLVRGQRQKNSAGNWEAVLQAFPDHEFSGEANWELVRGARRLKGKVTWPILNPGDLPGTVEFNLNVSVGDRKESKKGFAFDSAKALIELLHPLCVGTSATCAFVEPRRLPSEIADERYQRFKRLHDDFTLTNVDWVFGLRNDDRQFSGLCSIKDQLFDMFESEGFVIVALTPAPLDYGKDEERQILYQAEIAMGLREEAERP